MVEKDGLGREWTRMHTDNAYVSEWPGIRVYSRLFAALNVWEGR